jgi:Zn-dependent peptidase ImmA (M78 family)
MLDKKYVNLVERKAGEERGRFNLGHESPIGNSIFNILESRYNAFIFLYPLKTTKIAGFTRRSNDVLQVFINTRLPRGYQIFAAAHELYHIISLKDKNNNEFILCDTNDVKEDNDKSQMALEELKANYFAAAYLLPDTVMYRRFSYLENGIFEVDDILIDIIKLQFDYEIPYKTVIRRLEELEMIKNLDLLNELKKFESNISKFSRLLDLEIYNKIKELENISERKYHTLNIPKTASDVYKGGLLSYNKLKNIVEFYGISPDNFNINEPKIEPIDFTSIDIGDEDDD